MRETVTSPSVLSKKSAALKIFGSNLFLINRRIEFNLTNQWDAVRIALLKKSEMSECLILAAPGGIEPPLHG